jgi:hypothetical protein
MDWIDPKDKLPPQGKKILYFKNGDIYVVQRFAGHWIPMPFTDSKYGKLPPPDLWCDIELPDGSESYIEFRVNDVFYSLDDLEIHHPEQYREFLEIFSIK